MSVLVTTMSTERQTRTSVFQCAGKACLIHSQRIVIYNQGAEDVFGWRRDEALGKPLDILLPEFFRGSHRQHLRDFATGTVNARRMGERGTAISGLRRNGEEFPAEAAISKLEFRGAMLFTIVLRDITERRRREKEQQLLPEIGVVIDHDEHRRSKLDRAGRLTPPQDQSAAEANRGWRKPTDPAERHVR